MAELSIGGEAFHVEIEGKDDAPILMLSHAMGANLHMWDPQMPEFLKHYRVLRYDSRGHGDSVVSEGPYSIAELGRDALAILDTLGLETADFAGLSLGAMVGQWLLTHAPRRIGKAVLAAAAAQLAPPDRWNSRIQTVLHDGMGAIAPAVIENWFTKDYRDSHPDQVAAIKEMILKTPPEGYAATCAALRDADLREAIRSVRAPVLVMSGRHDATVPPGLSALVTSSIPRAKLITLEAAHLSNVEDAELFTEKAIAFLLAEPEPIVEPKIKKSAAPKAPRQPRAKKAPAEELSLEVIEAEPVPVKKALAKKALAKKAPAKKAPAKKAASKKAMAKKAAPKKAAAKKTAAKKTTVKKTAVKKAAPKKAVSKKAAAKKSAVKKTAVKKNAVKKTAVKKTAMKKSAAKKPVKKTIASRKTGPAKAARKPVKKMAAKKAKRR